MQKPLILFPWKQRVYKVAAYADGDDASIPGKSGSVVNAFKNDGNSITMDYTLRDKETYPYSGMYFVSEAGNGLIDLSGYDFLKLKMAVTPQDIYQIKLYTYLDGYTSESGGNTRCPLEKALVLEDSMTEYIIPIKEFGFLDWWFEEQQLNPADYKIQPLLKKVAAVNLQQTKQIAPGTEEQGRFVIRELSFHKTQTLLYILSGSGFLLSLSFVLVIFSRVRWKKGRDAIPLQYNPVELANYSDTNIKRLTTLIMENYTDPRLSVEMLYAQTGIPRRQITALIRKKHNLSFKQLLNKIRVTEAARLLKETDRNVTEIALALGFSGAVYFFQVFKAAYNISPSDYRRRG